MDILFFFFLKSNMKLQRLTIIFLNDNPYFVQQQQQQ